MQYTPANIQETTAAGYKDHIEHNKTGKILVENNLQNLIGK